MGTGRRGEGVRSTPAAGKSDTERAVDCSQIFSERAGQTTKKMSEYFSPVGNGGTSFGSGKRSGPFTVVFLFFIEDKEKETRAKWPLMFPHLAPFGRESHQCLLVGC